MDKVQAVELLLKSLSEWENKPKGDGYEYEKSFIEVMQDLNRDLLQLSLGEVPRDRNEKKSSDAVGSDRNSEEA
jgi:hypothetical protein